MNENASHIATDAAKDANAERRGEQPISETMPPARAVLPRSPGRQKGLGKVPGSGRKKGTPNHVGDESRELIIRRGQPIKFLSDIVRGLRVRVGSQGGPGNAEWVYPSLNDRLKAAAILAPKILPDLTAMAVKAEIVTDTREMTNTELACGIAFLLDQAAREVDRQAKGSNDASE